MPFFVAAAGTRTPTVAMPTRCTKALMTLAIPTPKIRLTSHINMFKNRLVKIYSMTLKLTIF